MRILVLGATGHIGQAIVRRALEQSRSVTAATRQVDPIALRGLPVEIIRLDPHWTALPAAARGHDVVIDAAAPYPLEPCVPGAAAWAMAIDSAVQHARCVVDATRAANAKLVYISAFTTLPRCEPPLAAWRRSTYPYFAAKQVMEQIVLEAATGGLPAVVINPAACLGPWEFRSESASFVRLVLNRRLPIVMDQVLSVIDTRDVAEASDAAIGRGIFGRPIPVAGHNIHLVELARQICDIAGIPCAAPMAITPLTASFAAFSVSAAFAAFNQPAPDVWRAIPLVADGFPMSPSPEQIAMELAPRSLYDTIHDSVVFHSQASFG